EHVAADMTAEDSHHERVFGHSDSPLSILETTLGDEGDGLQNGSQCNDTITIGIAYAASRAVPGAIFGVTIRDLHGYDLGSVITDPDSITVASPVERGILRLTLSPLLLNKGKYAIDAYIWDPRTRHFYYLLRRVLRLTVNSRPGEQRLSAGYINYPHQWERVK